jgi:hypothetical protein
MVIGDRRVNPDGLRGRYRETVDQNRLVPAVRSVLAEGAEGRRLIVITDCEIVPPEGWRYIIWDQIDDDVVVSIPPTDPHFWRIPDKDRVARIKHRIRSACLSICGIMIGLDGCDNPSCVLNRDVDSVNALDYMLRFGQEHGLEELAERGFAPTTKNPSRVQPLVMEPVTDMDVAF